jgi:hypothetical protein
MENITIIDEHSTVRVGLEIFIKNNFNEVSIHTFKSFYHFNSASFDDTRICSLLAIPSNC